MPEKELSVDNQNDSREKSESEMQVDDFPNTTKLLDKKLKDKKDNILKILEEWNLKDIFEKFLSSEESELCISSLIECENDETNIKEVILANLPEWYAYGVSSGSVVEIQINEPNTSFTWAATTDRDTEQARTDTEQARTDTEQIREKKNVIEVQQVNIIKANKEREILLQGRPDVDKKTREKAELAKQHLPEETKKQLEERGYDENFINDYILLRVTANEVKNDSGFDKNAVAQFENSVNELSTLDVILKNIDNACNISDTNSKSFDFNNIWQTRTELFNEDVWNQSLIEARENNMNSHGETYDKLFPKEMWEDDIINKYGNFLEWDSILEWDLKTFWQNYKNNPNEIKNKINEIKNNPNPSDEDKKFLQDYEGMILKLKEIKWKLEEKTKDMMEELTILSQIKWMYMCMWEWADFNLNKAREIENEDWILTLRGHIDWVDFAIRQDTNNPEARLQTSQKLARNENTFIIGWKDNFVDSNFILPSQNEIFDYIAETVSLKSSLENFDNIGEYFENLQSNIMWDMEKKFKNTEYVHHYMQWQVWWEKIIDDTLLLIKNKIPSIGNSETLLKSINEENNKDLYDFIKIIKFNIDNSTNSEKDNLDKCIRRILEIINSYQSTNWIESENSFKFPSIIENYLKDKAWLNWWNEDSRLKMLSDLFKYYSEKSRDTRSNSEWNNWWTPSKMIINDLYRDLFEFQWWGQSEVASSRDMAKKLQSNNTIAWQESENADLILENWPEW